jgi:type II secretory pathway pseudopilin PulG
MTANPAARREGRDRYSTGPERGIGRRATSHKAGAAFTLFELMIVMGIMALVMAMGLPSIIQTMRKEPLRKAVSDVVDGLSAARAQAILQGAPAEFVLEAADGSISVQRGENPNPTDAVVAAHAEADAAPAQPSPSEVRPFSARLNSDILLALVEVNLKSKMDAEEVRVRFYPNGTSDEFTILLQATTGARLVRLDSVTALADVEVVR